MIPPLSPLPSPLPPPSSLSPSIWHCRPRSHTTLSALAVRATKSQNLPYSQGWMNTRLTGAHRRQYYSTYTSLCVAHTRNDPVQVTIPNLLQLNNGKMDSYVVANTTCRVHTHTRTHSVHTQTRTPHAHTKKHTHHMHAHAHTNTARTHTHTHTHTHTAHTHTPHTHTHNTSQQPTYLIVLILICIECCKVQQSTCNGLPKGDQSLSVLHWNVKQFYKRTHAQYTLPTFETAEKQWLRVRWYVWHCWDASLQQYNIHNNQYIRTYDPLGTNVEYNLSQHCIPAACTANLKVTNTGPCCTSLAASSGDLSW